jgi:hypothetical protein
VTIESNSGYPVGARLKAAYDQLKRYEEDHPEGRRVATSHTVTELVSFLGTRLRGGAGMSAAELASLVEHIVSHGIEWAEWKPDEPTPERTHPDLFGPSRSNQPS